MGTVYPSNFRIPDLRLNLNNTCILGWCLDAGSVSVFCTEGHTVPTILMPHFHVRLFLFHPCVVWGAAECRMQAAIILHDARPSSQSGYYLSTYGVLVVEWDGWD